MDREHIEKGFEEFYKDIQGKTEELGIPEQVQKTLKKTAEAAFNAGILFALKDIKKQIQKRVDGK